MVGARTTSGTASELVEEAEAACTRGDMALSPRERRSIMKTVYLVLLAGVMTVCAACTTAPLAPPTTNVSGNWVGTWQYENVQQGSGDIRGSFQQDGASLAGNFNVTGPVLNRTANVTGAVTGNDIILNEPSTGRLTVSGNQITGIIDGLNPAKVTLRKQ